MRSSALSIGFWCLVGLTQCMQVSDGIEIDVAYQPEATPSEIRTDMGYRVRLDRALIAVGQVELIRCDEAAFDLKKLFVPGRARAHQLSSPTSLGVPLIIDLTHSTGIPVFAGTLRPPPGNYCGIRIVGTPADSDAEGLTKENLDMMEHSLRIAARAEDEAGAETWSVIVSIREGLPFEVRFAEPLALDRPVLEGVSIVIDQTAWFDGIDFAHRDASEMQRRITNNISSSLTVLSSYREAEL